MIPANEARLLSLSAVEPHLKGINVEVTQAAVLGMSELVLRMAPYNTWMRRDCKQPAIAKAVVAELWKLGYRVEAHGGDDGTEAGLLISWKEEM